MAFSPCDFVECVVESLTRFGFSFHTDQNDGLPVPGPQPETTWWWCLGEPVFPNIITSEGTFESEAEAHLDAMQWWLNNSIFSDEA